MPKIVITRGKTRDNRANLPRAFLENVEATYGGTRLGRQELEGVLFDDLDGSLWTRPMIEKGRVGRIIPPRAKRGEEFLRIVIGLDPPATSHKTSDACGIIVAAQGADKRYYVLEDASVRGERPDQWARRVAETFERWNVDRIIAETNQGGDMVEAILQRGEHKLPVTSIHARLGKAVRAEPVQAAYERGEVSHCGSFPELEDEMCAIMIDTSYAAPGSPDRADALVYALSELMRRSRAGPRVRVL